MKTGRPKIQIKEDDWKQVQKLAKMQCTAKEIAAFTEVSEDTWLRRCKADYGLTFADYIKKHAEGGKASLRRAQWLAAIDPEGNPKSNVMLIWLGKQILGQADKVDQESTNVDVELSYKDIKKVYDKVKKDLEPQS